LLHVGERVGHRVSFANGARVPYAPVADDRRTVARSSACRSRVAAATVRPARHAGAGPAPALPSPVRMADFLLVVGDSARARSWFERGLERAGAFGLGEPSDRLAAAGVQVAVWPRLAGDGPRIARRG